MRAKIDTKLETLKKQHAKTPNWKQHKKGEK